MANTTTITTTAVTNVNNFKPTGEVNIVSGVTNPIYLAAPPSQQINAGDVILQNNDSTYSWIGIPAVGVSGNNFTSVSSNADANNTATVAMQKCVHNNFAGLSISYRNPVNTSYGKNADRIGIATGRAKLAVDAADTNYAAATGVGTFWGVAVTTTNPAANNANCQVKAGSYLSVATANRAIGVQALPKAANDTYVYVDLVSSLVNGGVQPIDTAA